MLHIEYVSLFVYFKDLIKNVISVTEICYR